jgi:hypothetical protein
MKQSKFPARNLNFPAQNLMFNIWFIIFFFPLALVCDVCHVSKDDREGHRENSRNGDHRKVPPGKWRECKTNMRRESCRTCLGKN